MKNITTLLITLFAINCHAQVDPPKYQATYHAVEMSHDLDITIEDELSAMKALYVLIGDAPGKSNIRAIKVDLSKDAIHSSEFTYQRLSSTIQLKVYSVSPEYFVTLQMRSITDQFTQLTAH